VAKFDLFNFLNLSAPAVEAAEVDPEEILSDVAPDEVPAESPPAASNYREGDIQGINCASCVKFNYQGVLEEGESLIPTGTCDLWEAKVRGDWVSDGFASSDPPLNDKGEEMWDFADDQKYFSEIHLAGTEQKEEGGFVLKEILRTGEWPVIPTAGGVVKKPLKIIRDGQSDSANGVISMSEVIQNFDAKVIPNPQIPLSDDQKDHKNITRLNTGFVRGLSIVDSDSGSKLVAKMEFTEPEVKDKVLRGTYADVSCGIPWRVRSRGKTYGSTLEHVCITNRPFIDGLGPFLAASDKGDADVGHFGDVASKEELEEKTSPEEIPEEKPKLTFSQLSELLHKSIGNIPYARPSDYEIKDVGEGFGKIRNKTSDTTWTATFTISDEEDQPTRLELSDPSSWEIVEDEEKKEPSANSGSSARSFQMDDLEQARRLRELRFSQTTNNQREKEEDMPLTREALDALEMSDDARTAIQSVLDEHAQLRASARNADVDRRVDELKGLGLEERPGFLKLYRSVMLSDDGGPAVVLSEEGQEKERLTALEILDRTVEALKNDEGKLNLSDQHLVSGNDEKPPATPENEQKPLEERTAEARQSIFGKQ
jgi:hypothetical protein